MKAKVYATRPFTSVYKNKRGEFKRGFSSSPERAVIAAVRTLVLEKHPHANVYVYSKKGKLDAQIAVDSGVIVVTI